MRDLCGRGSNGRPYPTNPSRTLRCGGFSLVELLVVTVLAASAAVVAAPALSGWHARDRVDGAARALLASLTFARGEAIARGARVVVCPVDGTARCAARAHPCSRGPLGWTCGWAVVVDAGRAGRALRVYRRVPGLSIAAGSAPVEFTPPAGQVIGGFRKFELAAAGAMTLRDGDPERDRLRRCIRIAAGGRARLERGGCDGRRA
ncbi:type II secretion system protein GspH [Trinickia dabaoshanensis]|uniref:Type II secretion system protein H n=1 Tax=Trinickia dabaoshanensis TaxID=564714 RepID=A0A2N7VHB2_9BURK|nr:GspH/FimT family protein [Trinickia dabaoshanensis]PMS16532.1 type II secretion system protein GspH [Trinickia dabaoshanensis]